jgi:hypothetical protein
MFRWFRTAAPVRETGVAMVDPRPGDALLFVGAADPGLAAACAVVTGLNGRAVVVGRGADDQKKIESAAGAAGALVEYIDAPPAMLPLDTDTFNLVVIPGLATPGTIDAAVVAEAVRVAKPAGRVIIINGQRRAGVFGALQSPAAGPSPEAVLALLKSAGTVASRKLASVDGVSYYEARKPRT